jgi:hypothetical protein
MTCISKCYILKDITQVSNLTIGAENLQLPSSRRPGVIIPQSDREFGLTLHLGISDPLTSGEGKVEFNVGSFYLSKILHTVNVVAILWDRNDLWAGTLARNISRDRPLPRIEPSFYNIRRSIAPRRSGSNLKPE